MVDSVVILWVVQQGLQASPLFYAEAAAGAKGPQA